MEQAATRRRFLALLASAPLLATGGTSLAAEPKKLGRLIQDAQALARISQRIEAIGRGYLGTRYAPHTLIGGPKRPEVFVVRDDAFDCVTYCETVLAAALARDLNEYEPALRKIRYHHGEVGWRERNHYFADWCARNVENGLCRPVEFDTVRIAKMANTELAVGKREWSLNAIPQASLLANGGKLETGDIVGFVSKRANLDYSHTGFVTFGARGELMMRHASSTRRRVIDERMAAFIAANGVRYVTVLRPRQPEAAPLAPPKVSSEIPT